MKAISTAIIFLLFTLLSVSLKAQITTSSQWTWMKGDSTADQPGLYGTKGLASSFNKPSARAGHTTWTDNSGNLWLFGGFKCSCQSLSVLNDLWKYTPSTNQWTWISGDSTENGLAVYGTKGIASTSNTPGPRANVASWTDAAGNLWLFGGGQYDFGGLKFGDLWKFNPSINQWTWVSGDSSANQPGVYGVQGISSATNKPGARSLSASWSDPNGNFWLYGGNLSAGFNDLWKYDVTTSQWTWMKGNNTESQTSGVFGVMGTPASSNTPGALIGSSSWTDDAGKLWLFGGKLTSGENFFNTLWKYDPVTNNWTWINGSNTINQLGIYGTKGVTAATNMPGTRYGSIKWKDAYGNFWIFGGWGYDAVGVNSLLNDLWKYNLATNQWTWMNGINAGYQKGLYGTMGISNVANHPGGKFRSASWTDAVGNFWLFGGNGAGNFNDLWKLSNVTTLPVTLSSIKAYQQNSGIAIEWKVENESGIKQYEIEKSTDGSRFIKAGVQAATSNNSNKVSYSWIDINPQTGNNYYRISSTSLNGESNISRVVEVTIGKGASGYAVYPNPVVQGLTQLQFINQPKGLYNVRLLNIAGQVITSYAIFHQEGNITEALRMKDATIKGNYTVEIVGPDKTRKIVSIVY
jgi:hypothetical protein